MAKTLTGVVKSNKTDKTIIVEVFTRKTHPLYKKQYSSTTSFMAHDEKNEAKQGDKVVIEECRPLSARKRFSLKQVLSHSALAASDLKITKDEEAAKLPESKAKKTEEEKDK